MERPYPPAPRARRLPRLVPPPRGLVLAAACVALAGCSADLSRTFGLTRDAPNEFAVTTRAPLSMPPDFTLRPPRPGASRPQEQSTALQAQEVLVPQTALNGTAGQNSPGQEALVAAAGPPAPKDIRALVDRASALDQPKENFVDKLMFWRTPPQPGIVVDPQKEAQRLRENAALGKSPDSGVTPIIQPKRGSWFDNLF
ncbi:MAG: DUF3035 domain-containing protein [Rhodospirillales bacterium]|nr:DUF3035 domain-containing protein [Rhodospirillales bacterium]